MTVAELLKELCEKAVRIIVPDKATAIRGEADKLLIQGKGIADLLVAEKIEGDTIIIIAKKG